MRQYCRPGGRPACSRPCRRRRRLSNTEGAAALRRVHELPHAGSISASSTALQVLRVRPEVRAMSASALLPPSP